MNILRKNYIFQYSWFYYSPDPLAEHTMNKSDFLPPILLKAYKRFQLQYKFKNSTGLNGLDLKLIDSIAPNRNGFYVELGANNGISQSNTFKLQKVWNWSGLLIEPSPIRYAECVANRSFANKPQIRCAACVPFDYSEKFVEIDYVDLMSVARGLDVTDMNASAHADLGEQFLDSALRHTYGALARTLTSLLDEVNAPLSFDLLSLDVEGNEHAVLKGLDFNRYQPKWILVEVRQVDHLISCLLESNGYIEYKRLSENSRYSDILFRKRNNLAS